MRGFRIKKRVWDLVRSKALQKLSVVTQEKLQNFCIGASDSALKLQNPTLWDTRGGGYRTVLRARFTKCDKSRHIPTASRVSECRILKLQRSVTRTNSKILNFFSESPKITFEGPLTALGLVVIFFDPKNPHYVHVLKPCTCSTDFAFFSAQLVGTSR